MTLSDLIDEFRRRASDNATPPDFSDAQCGIFATEAEKEACLRAKLLLDDSGDFDQAIAAGQATILLDPLVLELSAASFTPTGSTAADLTLTGMDWIRDQCDWQTRTCSRPWRLAQLRDSLRLYPIPSVAGSLSLSLYRFPANAIADLTDEPEIPVQHHDGLVDWMLFKAFSTKDSEYEDEKRAATALGLFEQRFGPRPDADTLRRQQERRRVTTRPI